MTAQAPSLNALREVGDSFRMLIANFVVVLPMTLAPGLATEILLGVLAPGFSGTAETMPTGLGARAAMALFLSVAISAFAQGMVILWTCDALNGVERGLGDYAQGALRMIVPLTILSIVVALAFAATAVFFLIPGLYVLATFFVWMQCVLVEDAGLGALGRAQALSKGYRWPLVGAQFVIGLLLIGIVMIAGATTELLGVSESSPFIEVVVILITASVGALFSALVSIYTTRIYVRLKGLRGARTV